MGVLNNSNEREDSKATNNLESGVSVDDELLEVGLEPSSGLGSGNKGGIAVGTFKVSPLPSIR